MDRPGQTRYDFEGQTIVISGGSGVLGGEMACALMARGAKVAILYRSRAAAEEVVARAREQSEGRGEIIMLEADVLDRDSLEHAAAEVVGQFGPVDALVNGAGGNRPDATVGADLDFFDLPEEALRFVLDVNLIGTIVPSQIFGRAMAARKRGTIVNISSMTSTRPLTRVVAYSAAKAGIDNFTAWLATHMALNYSPEIRVNAIAPGFFLTRQNRFLLTEEGTGELTARGRSIIEHTPMGRFGNPDDLLGTLFWLLSPGSAFVTGVVVPVDGGFSAFAGV